ncbi:MAG: DUF418 domain-containing protein [Bradyrhizobium sp.]
MGNDSFVIHVLQCILTMPPELRTDVEPAVAALNPSERIDAIDALRGLALFGVFAIHVTMQFRVSIFEQFLPPAATTSALDRNVQALLSAAIELKAFALFSLLFGIGLAIQFERLAPNPRRAILLLRRLAVLLMFGLIHLFLIWNGDILTEYSLAGFLVLPLLWGPRWLLAVTAAFFLGWYLVMPLLPPVISWPTTAWLRDHVAEARQVYGHGGFFEILAFQIREVPAMLPLHVSIFPRTIALFLFGMWLWRTDIVRRPAAHRSLLIAVALTGVFVGGALTLAEPQMSWLGRGWFSVERLAGVLLAIGYTAAAFFALNTATGSRLLGWAAPLGRMAFTNYLAQSVIFSWIFFGYGLGLFGRVDVVTALAIGIAVYVALALLSAWWLKHYRFGPFEWLWRTLMYGVPQRLRRG